MTDSTSSGRPNLSKGSPQRVTTSASGASLNTRASAAWVAIAVALALLVLLIIFMLQNSTRTDVHFLGLTASLPVGMAILIAAVSGGVVVAIAGSARILQLRKKARRIQRPPA